MSAPPPNPHCIVELFEETPRREGGALKIAESNVQRFDNWEHEGLFEDVQIELSTEQMSQAEWRINDPDFKFIDRFSLADGVPLYGMRFYIGYGAELGEPVFKGVLARVQRGSRGLTLIAYDKGFLMRLEKRTGYNKGTDLAIMRKLVERNDLLFEGPGRGFAAEKLDSDMQDERNDWEQLSELANEAGLIPFVRQDTVFVKEPAKVGTPLLTLKYKEDFELLRDFDLTHKFPENQEGRPRRVEVRGRGRGGKRLSGSSGENKRGRVVVEAKRSLRTQTKAGGKRRAEATKGLDREHAFECQIRRTLAPGGRRADVRRTFRLENVGKLWSGDYIIDSLRYSMKGVAATYGLYRDTQAG